MTIEKANKIFDLLVSIGGASEYIRDSFIYEFTEDSCNEFRFIGNLGFGGKYWQKGYVTCYKEDETPERKNIIEKLNSEIKKVL